MPERFELEGQRFARLIVGKWIPEAMKWSCLCDCGVTKNVASSNLTGGITRSCGCLRKETTSARRTTHGMSKSHTYKVWSDMRARCENPNTTGYANYGGRGIKVCERWLEFENFYTDMGECPVDLSIERERMNDGYEPGNCKWATWIEQQNNKRNIKLVEFRGKSQTLTRWAAELGLPFKTIYKRIADGWTIENALTKPVRSFT